MEIKDWIEDDEFENLANLDETEKKKILDELEELFNKPASFDNNEENHNNFLRPSIKSKYRSRRKKKNIIMDKIITSAIVMGSVVLIAAVIWGGYSLVRLFFNNDEDILFVEDNVSSEQVALLQSEINELRKKNQELIAENNELRQKLQELRTVVDIELERLKVQIQEESSYEDNNSPQSNSDSQTSSINTSNTNQTKNNLTANQNSQGNQTSQSNQTSNNNQTRQANQTSQANQANRTNQTNQASQNNSSDNTQSNNDDQFTYYTVKQGDTLWSISMDFYGSGQYYKKIMQYNNMRSERELYAGKRLKIPKL